MVPSKRGRSGNHTGSDRFLFSSAARAAGFVFASAATVRLTALLAALSCIWLQPAAAQMPQAPEIAVSGNGVDITNGATRPSATDHTNFGDAALLDESGENAVVERTFTISNGGTGTLTLGADAVSLVYPPGVRPGGWRVKTQPAETVAAAGTTTFTIAFDPASAKVHSVFVHIASDDADENPFRFRVGGRGVTARMGLTWAGENLIPTGTVDFGELELPAAATQQVVTVANTGRYPLALGDNAVTIEGDADFTVVTQPAATVEPGETTTFTLAFDAAVPGERTATATLAVANDLLREPEVEISLEGEGAVPAVTVAAVAASVTEGTAASFILTRTRSVVQSLTVGVTVSETGDMLAGTAPTSVTFAAGSETARVSLATEDDTVSEAHSAVTVTVNADSADPITYEPGTPAAATVTVNNDDVNQFTIAFAQSSYSVDENAGPLTVGIVFESAIGQAPVGPVSVALATVELTALSDNDYTSQSMTVDVQPSDFDASGRATLEVSIPINDDSNYEGAETFRLDLSSPGATHSSDSASLGTPIQATVTIADDDLPVITVTADTASVTEGTAAAFILTRTRSATEALTVGVTVTETGDVLATADKGQKSVTFAAGMATATLSLPTVADTADEDDSVVTVTVDADSAVPATYEPGSPADASVTVNDDDVNQFTIAFTQASYSEAENGDDLSAFIRFRSASGRPPAGAVSVNVATRAGSALAGQDFTTTTETISVPRSRFSGSGTVTHRISVPISNDGDYEGPETFELVLSSPGATDSSDSASLGTTATATATITDDDRPEITVTADTASVTEGTTAVFTLRRTGIVTEPLTVGVTVSETGDVLAATQEGQKSVIFGAGGRTATLFLPTQADSADEDDSTVTVTVDNDSMSPATYVRGSPAAASVTVIDDDVNRFTIAFAEESYSVAENGVRLLVEVAFTSSSNRPPVGNLSVTVKTRGVSAQSGQDFAGQSSVFTVRPGDHFDASGRATHTLYIPISDDSASEPAETFLVELSSPEATDSSDSASLGTPASTTVTITDNEIPGITVAADAASVTEGMAASFTLTRTRIVTETLTVGITVEETGAMLSGTAPTSVTFAAGALTATLSLPTVDDAADEDDSTVTFTVAADTADPATYALGTPAAATVTVNDNDANQFTIAFAQSSYSVTEDGGILSVGVEFVSSSGRPPEGVLSVTAGTREGSAEAGRDFSSTSPSAILTTQRTDFDATGRATTTLYIPILDDSASEAEETFEVVLSAPMAADSSDSAILGTAATATVTITDNEPPGITVAAQSASVTEGMAAVFTLTRTRIVTDTLTVAVTVTESGEMLSGTAPTSVTFGAGSLTAELSLATVDDAASEADSVVRVTVNADSADPVTYVPGTPATATVTVNDDEVPAVTVVAQSASVTEGNAAAFTLTRTGATDETLEVGVSVEETGGMLSGTAPDSVTFGIGSATVMLSLATEDDAATEANSVVTVTVDADTANPITYAPGTPATATVTVIDNDIPAITVVADADSVTEGTAAAFTLTRTGLLTAPLTVGVTVSEDGDVLAAADEGQKSVMFTANSATAELSVTTQNDTVSEAHSAVTVTVNADTASPATYMPGTPAAATVTVNNDDVNEINIQFSQSSYSVDEDAGPLTIGIRFVSAVGQPPVGPVSVFLSTLGYSSTSGFTAVSDNDYTSQFMSVGVQPGDFDASGRATLEVSIPINDDSNYEGAETFELRLTSPVATHSSDGATLGTDIQVTVTIADDDLPAVTVAADAASVTEGNAAAFTLRRTGILTEELAVEVSVMATGDMLAGTPDSSVTFEIGSATAALSVATDNDMADEADSVVTVTVEADSTNPATYEPGTPATATVTVTDDDLPAITVAADAASVTEGEAAAFTLTRAGVLTAELTVGVTVTETGGDMLAAADEGQKSVMFEAGSATVALSLPTVDDAASEADSVVTVTVDADTASTATYVPGTPATATVTVTDNELPAISIAADAASVTEGTAAAFTLTRTGVMTGTLTVGVTVSETGGDMLAAADEGQKSVTFAAGMATAPLSVDTQGDATDEADSVVTVTVDADTTNPATYELGTPATATVTVNDDDLPAITVMADPAFVPEDSTVTEGEPAAFILTRTGIVTAPLTVGVTVTETGGDMLAAADEGQRSVMFAANAATATLSLATDDDMADEADSVVTVTVVADTTDPATYEPGTTATASVTVTDDDLPAITVAADAASVTEGTVAAFTLTRAGILTEALTVGVTVSESRGNSEFENDGVLAPSEQGARTVTFAAESPTAALSVATEDDTADEADSVVTVTVVAPGIGDPITYAPGTPAAASVTVSDDDGPLELTWSVIPETPIVDEGATAHVTIRLAVDKLPTEHVSFRIFQTPGTAEAGSDFEVIAPRLIQVDASDFTAVSGGAGFFHEFVYEVDIVDDEIAEVGESFTIKLGLVTAFNEGHAVVGTEGTITIRTNDQPVPVVSIAAGTSPVTEGMAAEFTLTRTGATDEPLEIGVIVEETGDMLHGGQSGFSFAAGSATATLSLATVDDAVDETDSVVTVTVNTDIANPITYAPGTPATASVTVNDNDVPAITVAADTASVPESEAAAFTLTRTGLLTEELTVGVTVEEDGDMLSGTAPTSVTFAANSATVALSLPTADDAADEVDSVVTVTVVADTTSPATYELGTTATASVTVNDNDLPAVTVAADSASVTEGEAAAFTLTRAGILTGELTVVVTVEEDGDMLAAADEGEKSVTFEAGSAAKTLIVETQDDAAEEAHSAVTVTVKADIADPATYVRGTPAAATVTVNDNEVLSITIAAVAASVTEGTDAVFTLTRTRIVTEDLTVAVNVTATGGDMLSGTAPTSVDFTGTSLTAELRLPTVGDAADEADGVVTVEVVADTADPPAYLLGTPATATVTVNDDDLPAITIAAVAASVTEGNAAAFTLTRAGILTDPLTVGVTVTETGDVLAATEEGQRSVMFTANSATATLSVATQDDAADEADSVVTVTVDADTADPATYVPGTTATATVTVNDNDVPGVPIVPAISIAADAASVTEGMAASFTLTRTGVMTAALTVGVRVSEDGDMLAGTAPASVTFEDGSATVELSLATVDDAASEADSVVMVTVDADSADPVTYAPGTPATATVTVHDNDLPAITVAADAPSVTEGTAASFTLTRTGVVTDPLTVGVTVSEDGDMLAGAAPASVTFARSSATATLSLATEDDTADEANSAVTVTVVADSADPITYAPGTPAAATVTVTDNDAPDVGMAQRISGAREWLVRFGRTVTAMVSETLGSRMSEQGPKGDRLTIAGRAVPVPAGDGSATPPIAAAFDDASRDRADDHGSAGEVPLDTLLSASGFAFSQGSENGSGWSIWGQGSGGRFSGEEGSLSLFGEVVSAAAGLEYAGLDSLGGIAVIHGRGGGGLRTPAAATAGLEV